MTTVWSGWMPSVCFRTLFRDQMGRSFFFFLGPNLKYENQFRSKNSTTVGRGGRSFRFVISRARTGNTKRKPSYYGWLTTDTNLHVVIETTVADCGVHRRDSRFFRRAISRSQTISTVRPPHESVRTTITHSIIQPTRWCHVPATFTWRTSRTGDTITFCVDRPIITRKQCNVFVFVEKTARTTRRSSDGKTRFFFFAPSAFSVWRKTRRISRRHARTPVRVVVRSVLGNIETFLDLLRSPGVCVCVCVFAVERKPNLTAGPYAASVWRRVSGRPCSRARRGRLMFTIHFLLGDERQSVFARIPCNNVRSARIGKRLEERRKRALLKN